MYTLKQLALFDRCLFVNDFRDSLIEVGMSESDAMMVARFINHQRHKGNNVGIVAIYQEYIDWSELHEAIDKILVKFFKLT